MSRKFKTMDGNNAAAHVAYAFTEVAAWIAVDPLEGEAKLEGAVLTLSPQTSAVLK